MDANRPETRPAPLAYRPLLPVAIAFATGIVGREYLAVPPEAIWAFGGAALLGFPLARLARRGHSAMAALYLVLALAGWVRLDMTAGPPPSDSVAHHLGAEPRLLKVRGVVAGEVQQWVLPPVPLAGEAKWLAEEAREARFDLDVEEAEAEGRWLVASGRLRVTLAGPGGELRYGDRVVAVGTARRPSAPSNPGELDFARLARRRGIEATMAVTPGCLTVEANGRGHPLLALAYWTRGRLRRLLAMTLGEGTRAKALLSAALLGDRTQLDEELDEAFKRSGTAHLLAVSGLNVALVAWVVWKIAALLGLGRTASGVVVLASTTLYALVCGLSPPVFRATLMTAVLVVSIVGRRRPDLLQSTAIAALVILLIRPFDLFDAGFQLSFAAVASMICLKEDVVAALRPRPTLLERVADEEDLPGWHRARLWFRPKALNAFGVSTAAWLGVFPLLAYYFNTFSPVTLFANLFAVPLYGMVTVVGFVHAGVATVFPPLAAVPALVVRNGTVALVAVVRAAERLPMAWTYCATPALGWVIGYYALALLVAARRRLRISGAAALAVWVAGGLVYVVATWREPRPAGLEMTALDVQHGLAVVLRYPDGSTVLYDCGTYGRRDVGRWTVAPALWHWGVRRIDLLVVSHADTDHVNGIPSLLDRFPVGRVVHSRVLARAEAGQRLLAMLDERGIPHETAQAGDRFELGRGNVLDVLAPTAWTLRHRAGDQNENSLVVATQHEGRRILLGGDIQRVGAIVLPRSGADVRADVLVVPHHGCEMKQGEGFARVTRPSYAVCSNRADHLARSTLERFEALGSNVLATCWDGAVTVQIRKGEMQLNTFRRRGDGRAGPKASEHLPTGGSPPPP